MCGRFLNDYTAFRSGNAKTRSNRSPILKAFFVDFEQIYAPSLCQSHLFIILQRNSSLFVGTKALNTSLRFIDVAVRKRITRK